MWTVYSNSSVASFSAKMDAAFTLSERHASPVRFPRTGFVKDILPLLPEKALIPSSCGSKDGTT